MVAQTKRRWSPRGDLREAFIDVLTIVTAFTVAHSMTLALASLHIVEPPARFSESAIALSVALAALNNIYPLARAKRWIVAGCFGLVHGFGFASVLTDLGLPQGAFALARVLRPKRSSLLQTGFEGARASNGYRASENRARIELLSLNNGLAAIERVDIDSRPSIGNEGAYRRTRRRCNQSSLSAPRRRAAQMACFEFALK
ncbi:MAG: HupE/UreJ family protein, partial [Methylocystis sp.]|nr:HupE/UreJ family protein [Methylocystis sp.]